MTTAHRLPVSDAPRCGGAEEFASYFGDEETLTPCPGCPDCEPCTDHAAMKADPSHAGLTVGGVQDPGAGPRLRMLDCDRCHSTLGVWLCSACDAELPRGRGDDDTDDGLCDGCRAGAREAA